MKDIMQKIQRMIRGLRHIKYARKLDSMLVKKFNKICGHTYITRQDIVRNRKNMAQRKVKPTAVVVKSGADVVIPNAIEVENCEIERKWLFDPANIPTDLKCVGECLYEQAYLSIEPEFRIRKKQKLNTEKPIAPTHVLCIKSKGDLSRIEVQKELTEREFNDLMVVGKLTKDDFIKKQPKTLIVNGHKLVVGLADSGRETGFWYGEIEYASEEEANAFEVPSWFGREVTHEPEYKMANYWARTRVFFKKPTKRHLTVDRFLEYRLMVEKDIIGCLDEDSIEEYRNEIMKAVELSIKSKNEQLKQDRLNQD